MGKEKVKIEDAAVLRPLEAANEFAAREIVGLRRHLAVAASTKVDDFPGCEFIRRFMTRKPINRALRALTAHLGKRFFL
jgi:hypothetical protein